MADNRDAASQPSQPSQDSGASALEARVGTALNSKWTLERLLGVGGMGAVFAARHRNGARAAVKLLHAELATDASIRERFLREGKIANRIDHPARVPVTDDDVSDLGEPFLVMDLLEGETLNQARHRQGGKLGLEPTLRVFDTVLELLAKCHEAGVVHRDVKPANIFITTDNQVKVLDFGVARMREANSGVEATRAGTAIGTPSYMAPKQALGLDDQVDGRSDVWSVGACIYVSLTGQRLNHGPTEAQSFVMAATQAAPSIANIAPDLPVEIVAFVDKALAFKRDDRFQDATAMRSELLGLLAALRAGHLVASAPKKATGVQVRGNDAVDDDEMLSPKEQQKVRDVLSGVWKQIGVCMGDVRQYGWTHPGSVRSIQQAFQQLADALAEYPSSVRWDVGAGAFMFGGGPVWAPDRMPFDRIPYRLFADGVRHIQIKHGVTEEEFRDLVAILLTDGGDAEGDSVTALWDRRFEHVAYLAIDSFADSDGEGGNAAVFGQQVRAVAENVASLAQLDRAWDDESLKNRAMQINLSAQLRESGDAAANLAVDPLTRSTLGAQMNLGEDNWRERFLDAFADGYISIRVESDRQLIDGALREWANDQLLVHSHAATFQFVRGLSEALATRMPNESDRLERAVADVMLPVTTISAILQDLAKEGRDPTQSGKEVDPVIVAGVERALTLLGDARMLALACGCYDAVRSEPLREVMVKYINRWSRGAEPQLAGLLETCGSDLGVFLVKLLAELATPAALASLEHALKNLNLAVRIEALWHMPADKQDQVRAEIERMLDESKASVRTDTLRIICARGLVLAGPALVRRIQTPQFHERPPEERKQWLEAVATLSPARAESVCAELLATAPLIPSAALEVSRALAAEILSTKSSDEALHAAREATKKRWWNTAPVREAAERALRAIEERRAAQGIPRGDKS